MRTWSATINIYDRAGSRTSLDARESDGDLMREQTQMAVNEASRYLADGREVSVILWKRTKARGLERDRTYVVYRDRRGRVRYQ